MAVQVDYRISPSDQFSVYSPDTKSNKTITYFTLLAKIRGDLNIRGGGGSAFPVDIVDAQNDQLLVYDAGSGTWKNRSVGIFKNIVTTSSTDWEEAAYTWNLVENTWETGISESSVVADLLEDTLYLVAESGLSIVGDAISDTITFNNIDKGSDQYIFKNIAVSGQSTIVADSNNDTLTFVSGTGVTITTDATSDAITISTAGIIDGSGTTNYVAKFTDPNTIGDSQIFDNGTNVGIGTALPSHKVDVDGGVFADYFQLDTTYSDGAIAGKLSWNSDRETAELGLDGTVSLILGQDTLWYVKNQSGSAIPKGRAVRASGALGASSRITVDPMVADGSVSSKYLLGITIEEIANGDDGFVMSQGKIRGIDTSGYTAAGVVLYCDPSNDGQLTETEPAAPDLKLPIAFTVDKKNNGTLAVRVTAGTTIAEANDVQITSVADNDFLVYNNSTGAWENEAVGIFKTISVSSQSDVVADAYNDTLTLVAGTNITITTDAATDSITINSPDAGGTVTNIATTAPIQGGPITTTGTISITQSGSSTDGYLSSTDWTTFNSKEPALTKGDLTEATSGILTIGSGTGAVIGSGTTIEVSQSGASTSGYLSSTDWNTFNDKEPAVTKGNLTETTSSVLTITGGTNAIIGSGTSIAVSQADASTSGYLSSTDWNAFSGKADDSFTTIAVSGQTDIVADSATDTLTFAAGSGVTIATDAINDTITISATGSGGTVTSVDLTAGTGISVSGGPITSSGSITVTNTAPDQTVVLTAGTGITTSGTYPSFSITNSAPDQTVVLTGAGTTSVAGTYPSFTITSNDQYDGTVTSVGITAGTGISVTGSPITSSGSITVANSAPDQTVVLTAGTGIAVTGTYPSFTIANSSPSSGGTVTSVATSAPLTGGTITSTGTIGIDQSSSTVDGYLSSTDWNTFNDKASLAFKTVSVSGQSDIVADAADDTLTVAQGDRIEITTDATTDTLTITHGLGDGVDLATAQAFEARVVADGGTFEAVWPIAVAIGALSGGTPANTSSNNTDGTVLQNIALDAYGHVLGYGSYDLDDRYVQSLIGGDGISVSGSPSTTSGAITVVNTDLGSDQNIFKNVAVSGQTTIVADSNDDTLTVAAGTGITLGTAAASDTLTITNSAPDQTVALTGGTGISISGTYPSFTITGTAQSSYTNLISAQVGETNGETTRTLTYGSLYSLSALADVGALTSSTPVMDMYNFTKVQYTGGGGLQAALLSSAFASAAINGTAVATSTDLITADFVYNSQMAAMMMQNHYNEQAKIDLSQVNAMLTIVGSLTLPEAVQTRLIVVHFGQYINSYDEAGASSFTNKRPDVWQYGYSSTVSGTLTESFFGLTMANNGETDISVSTAMSGWGFALINTEDSADVTSTATLENSSLIRIRCREEYYTT